MVRILEPVEQTFHATGKRLIAHQALTVGKQHLSMLSPFPEHALCVIVVLQDHTAVPVIHKWGNFRNRAGCQRL